MHALTPTGLLKVWEQGEGQHPIDRALTLLAVACPEKNLSDLAHLNIGQRDTLLFRFRQLNFGSRMDSYAECPKCGAELESSMDIEKLLSSQTSADAGERSAAFDGFVIRYHLPNSIDLAECFKSGIPSSLSLLENCVSGVTGEVESKSVRELPQEVTSSLVSLMSEQDPFSDVKISMQCNQCGHQFSALLDILSFVWKELTQKVGRLLQEVYILAVNFGWSERDILSMNSSRRKIYLDMVA